MGPDPHIFWCDVCGEEIPADARETAPAVGGGASVQMHLRCGAELRRDETWARAVELLEADGHDVNELLDAAVQRTEQYRALSTAERKEVDDEAMRLFVEAEMGMNDDGSPRKS